MGVCSRHIELIMHFHFFLFWILFLFLSWLCIVFPAILPCSRPRLKWQPPPYVWQLYTKPAYHHTLALDMHVNKHIHFKVPPFPVGTYSHSKLSTTSDLPPLLRCIHNQLGSKSISHIPCFPFDIQIDLLTGSPANKKNSLAESNLVTSSSFSLFLPSPLYLMLGMKYKRKSMLYYGLLVYV